MSSPKELSFEEILNFMLEHGGKVTNHELVKHFKRFLTDPDTRDEARNTFKKHVNALASIKNQNNEKWLILKRKYLVNSNESSEDIKQQDNLEAANPVVQEEPEVAREPPPYIPPPVIPPQLTTSYQSLNETSLSNISANQDNDRKYDNSLVDEYRPIVTPRRKSSSDKELLCRTSDQFSPKQSVSVQENLQNIQENQNDYKNYSASTATLSDIEQKISVKERKQMFNRMASEGDILRLNNSSNRKSSQGVDEEDRASVVSLDPKGHEWLVRASQGNYHALAKMCSENPRYAKIKDPSTVSYHDTEVYMKTAMHWACKRGDENIVKLIAGIARSTVNARSGYTPLHIAMQFQHENVYKLLVDVYDADPNLRDWSGRKPRQYMINTDTSLSTDAYRRYKSKSHKKQSDRELGFLRIGSLNVRVKKTTEAFSNFLGVGSARASTYAVKLPLREEVDHLKSWGSADNIQEGKSMPPPQYTKVKRRAGGTRRSGDPHSRSTPTTPNQPRACMSLGENSGQSSQGPDSDSDTAAGFHSAWRAQRASNYT